MQKNKLIIVVIIIAVALIMLGAGVLFLSITSVGNEPLGKEGNEYDAHGNIIKSTWYLDNGRCQVSEFDEDGNVKKFSDYSCDGSTRYDKDGNVISMK